MNLIKIKEAAQLLNVSRQTVYRYMAANLLMAVKIPNKKRQTIRICCESIERLLATSGKQITRPLRRSLAEHEQAIKELRALGLKV